MDSQEPSRKTPLLRVLSRWKLGRYQRRYEWQHSPSYWRLAALWNRFRFFLVRRRFTIGGWISHQGDVASLLLSTVQVAVRQVMFAVLAVVVLESVDRRFIIDKLHDGKVGFSPTINQWVPSLLVNLRFDAGASASLLATFVQVAGVFLGLYFAALSPVVNSYAAAAEDVRQRLIDEMVRNGYINLIAFFAAFASLLLAETAFGVQPGPSSLLLATILAVVAVLSFVVLGVRTFSYLDPSQLGRRIPGEVIRWITAATPRGRRWRTAALQHYYQQRAESLLQTQRRIVELGVQNGRSSVSGLVGVALGSLILWQAYSALKNRIPSSSLWFPRVSRHPNWHTSPGGEVDRSVLIGLPVRAESAPDLMWLEKHLSAIVTSSLEGLLPRNDRALVSRIVSTGGGALEAMAGNWQLVEAFQLLGAIRPLVLATVRRPTPAVRSEVEEQTTQILDLLDHYGLGIVRLLLGLSRKLDRISTGSFTASIEVIQWDRLETINAADLPRPVLDDLGIAGKRLAFEQEVDGDTTTPTWYTQQFAARSFLDYLTSTLAELVSCVESAFAGEIDALIDEERYLYVALLADRGTEACRKCLTLVESARRLALSLESLRRVEEEPWPTIDLSNCQRRVELLRKRLVSAQARIVIPLSFSQPRPPDWPDFAGQARFTLASEAYRAMAEGDEELFAGIFRPLLVACIKFTQQLSSQIHSADTESQMVFVTEPIADLIDLSGYARIYADLDGKDYWDVARSAWDTYLATLNDPEAVLEYFAATVVLREGVFGIPPFQTIRTRWRLDLENRLRDRGLLSEDMLVESSPMNRDVHASPLIRALVGRSWTLRSDPANVFLVTFVKAHKAADNVPLGQLGRFLEVELDREERHEASAAGGT